jgi:hypothetical protein
MTGGNIGIQHYPIFEDTYKPRLDGLIIDRYWNREIGVESVDMFQLAMRRKMNEIMPFYNQLYASTKIEYDPLSTIDLHTISASDSSQTNDNTGTNNTTSASTSGSRSVNSETPQSILNGSGDYATSASDANATSSVAAEANEESTQQSNAEASGDTRTTGYQGAASDLIIRYRESLINVDLMVLAELDELFMGIWDTPDTYTNNRNYGGY